MKKTIILGFSALFAAVFLFSFFHGISSAQTTIEECIKNYQSQNVSYDDAKIKCSSLQNTGTVQIQPYPYPANTSVPGADATQNVVDPCILKYVNDFKLTYEQAKLKCYPARIQETPNQQIAPKPAVPVSDDCVKNYINQTGATADDARIKCASIMPSVQQASQAQIQIQQNAIEACVQKYVNSGYSPEAAEKECSNQILPENRQITPAESCVKKYIDVFNISYDEAKTKCVNVIQPTAVSVKAFAERRDCADLEKQLAEAVKKLNSVSNEPIDGIMAEVRKIKQELLQCQPPAIADKCAEIRKNIYNFEQQLKDVKSEQETQKIKNSIENQRKNLENCAKQNTPGIKNPCDETPHIKTALEEMVKKEAQIRSLIEKGEIEKTALEDIRRQIEFMKKRMEQMQFACQQGNKPLEESPCAKLAKQELIYGQNQDSSLTKEIAGLKEICRTQGFSLEKVEGLAGVEEAYKAKLKAVVEGTFGQEQVDQLKKAGEEKNNLINGIVAGAKDLDMRGITIVGRIKINPRELTLDGFKINPIPLKIEIKSREININPSESGSGMVIQDEGSKAEITGEIEYKDGELIGSNSGKPIEVFPSEIKDKIGGVQPSEIKIEDKEFPQYAVKVDAKAKLLGFIPISTSRNYVVNAQTGASQESSPWWKFLVKY